MMRDFEAEPYTDCECRVVSFLNEIGIGGGDDPIGFLIASHAEMARQRTDFRKRYAESKADGDRTVHERDQARASLRQILAILDLDRDQRWMSNYDGVAFA